MNETTASDLLDTTATSAPATKPKKAKKVGAEGKKPGKAVTTKPAAKKADAKPAKKADTKAAKPAKKADAAAKPAPKKVSGPAPSTQQPEDKVVLKAVERLKEPTMASKFAADLGVHRRVIRAQLQRLSKDKANGVAMVKKGPHWLVSKK